MPTVEDHKEAALIALRRYAQPDTEPKLTDPELNSILDSVQRASFWASATTFIFGAVVLPVTKSGHRYRCIQAGTTASAEPAWPKRNAAVIADGTVQWEEAGPDFDNVYDIRAATHEAWTMKAGKASALYDQGNQLYSQIAENCRTMAEAFDPIKIA